MNNYFFDYVCYQVSNTYAKEVAGNSAIAPHLYKFHGILNGIDPDIWDPFNDNFIPVSNSFLFRLILLGKLESGFICFNCYFSFLLSFRGNDAGDLSLE